MAQLLDLLTKMPQSSGRESTLFQVLSKVNIIVNLVNLVAPTPTLHARLGARTRHHMHIPIGLSTEAC